MEPSDDVDDNKERRLSRLTVHGELEAVNQDGRLKPTADELLSSRPGLMLGALVLTIHTPDEPLNGRYRAVAEGLY